ncbi:MAG: hypothetical protein HZY76_11995 [Anaerolineae bacterium]|nr:MAG: hypothetical protein HZY76_11995 [Anaerolineae bacterium]
MPPPVASAAPRLLVEQGAAAAGLRWRRPRPGGRAADRGRPNGAYRRGARSPWRPVRPGYLRMR